VQALKAHTGEATASGWLKVRRYAEVPEQDEHLPLLSIYIWLSSGDWLIGVVKDGGVSSSNFLGGFKGWGLWLEVWTPLKEVVLIWLASRWGEIAARILRGVYGDARAYVEKVKLVWLWVILNSLFRFCIWHTGRLPSVNYDASKCWCMGQDTKRG
jgi:hypothetical protein